MLKGHATEQGTLNFFKKHNDIDKKNIQNVLGLSLSNVGVGTYLGNVDNATDVLVKNAVKQSILAGINVIDTAINYRSQKAERSVGAALSDIVEEGMINREEIFVSTKNGYVTNDGDIKEDFWQYVNREYVSKGVVKPNDITSGYHCMTVPYLEDQLERSRKNLGLDCIDLMYLHNAIEGQIKDKTKEEFLKNLRSCFEFYESKRKENVIRYYGLATWECFRVTKDNPQFLELADVVSIAEKVGGENHGFRFIQLPYNMYLDHALMIKNQTLNGKTDTLFNVVKHFNIGVFTSVPLMQGKLLSPGVLPEFGNLKPPLRALQFVRSTPGVIAPLVGHKSTDHVKENLEILKIPPIDEIEFYALVKKLTAPKKN